MSRGSEESRLKVGWTMGGCRAGKVVVKVGHEMVVLGNGGEVMGEGLA